FYFSLKSVLICIFFAFLSALNEEIYIIKYIFLNGVRYTYIIQELVVALTMLLWKDFGEF
ncbi:hypothetical protein LWE90_19140, partial [Clostridioides difficile]|uniref:hypothetical protein n=1 Tax=Clostridioides difficile TaxID=1496 RepID=UPI001E415D56